MTVDLVDLLRELDFSIAEGTSNATWFLQSPDGTSFEVVPTVPVIRLTAHSVRSLGTDHARGGRPLHVGESATGGVVKRAKEGQLDILTAQPIQLIHAGVTYAVEQDEDLHPAVRTPKRPAWIRWAVERYLLLTREPSRQATIAATLGTSQQAVSNAARSLGDLVADSGNGLIATNRSALLEHWFDEYAGPGGQEFGWYSLDSIVEQATKALSVAKLLELNPLVSGDVAADRLAPWKLPSRGRIYVDGPIDLAGEGFVPAPVADSTLVTCIPRDPSLWRLTDFGLTSNHSDEMVLADAAIVYWDMLNSEDTDTGEAASHLRELIWGEKP